MLFLSSITHFHTFPPIRFIPIERWPLIILSLFALHNETRESHLAPIPYLS